MTFQELLKLYREKKGYSAKEFAENLKIPYTTYMNYENQGREPKYELLLKMADILNVTTDELLGRKINKNESDWKHVQDILKTAGIKITHINNETVELSGKQNYFDNGVFIEFKTTFQIERLISLVLYFEESMMKSQNQLFIKQIIEVIASHDKDIANKIQGAIAK